MKHSVINPRTGEAIKEGDLRVWFNINMMHTVHVYVSDQLEAIRVINNEANRQLENPKIQMNAFGLEKYEDNGDGLEWCEWYDDESGDDIQQHEETLKERGEL